MVPPHHIPPHPGQSLSVWREPGLGSGLESEGTTLLGVSCPFLGLVLIPAMFSLEPVGCGLTGVGVGLCWVHKHQPTIPRLLNKGSPQQNSLTFPKTRLGPWNAAFLPPAGSC